MAGALGATAALILCACAVTGVGVEGSVGYDGGYYDGGYYEPYGYDYGDWGVGYRVGPSRCCEHRDEHRDHPVGRGRAGHAPAYRPAPAGRPAPSIPGRHRTH
jgi:hypothetical protein